MAIHLITLAAGLGLASFAVLAMFLEQALKPLPVSAEYAPAGLRASRVAARSCGAVVPATSRPQAVPVSAAEALAIAAELRALPDDEVLRAAAQNAAAIVRDLQRGATSAVTPCALLIGGHCCVERARPSACTHCAALAPEAANAPRITPADAPRYELNHAVLIALRTPRSEMRAAGDELFADCTLVA